MRGLLSAIVIAALAFAPAYSAVEAPASAASEAPQQEKLSADIQKKTDFLSDAEANKIAADVKTRILKEYGPKYDFENFTVEFGDQEDKGEVVGVDVSVNVDMTLTQDPAQSANVEILSEAKTHYKVPSNSWFLYHVEVSKLSKQGTVDRETLSSGELRPYQLFSREDITSDETILTPLK